MSRGPPDTVEKSRYDTTTPRRWSVRRWLIWVVFTSIRKTRGVFEARPRRWSSVNQNIPLGRFLSKNRLSALYSTTYITLYPLEVWSFKEGACESSVLLLLSNQSTWFLSQLVVVFLFLQTKVILLAVVLIRVVREVDQLAYLVGSRIHFRRYLLRGWNWYPLLGYRI